MLSVNHAETWEIASPSFSRFPTVPSTFDEVYWETYWDIVHQPDQMALAIIKKIDDERRQNENRLTADQKRTIEKEKAERVAAEKKQEELKWRKRKIIIELPTQSPLSHHPESTFSQEDDSQKKRSAKSPTQSLPSKRKKIDRPPSPPQSSEQSSKIPRKEMLHPHPVRLISFFPVFLSAYEYFLTFFYTIILGFYYPWCTQTISY